MSRRNNRWFARPLIPPTLVALGALAAMLAGPAPASAQTLGSRVNGLMSFDFADHYITPRGLNVENQGLVGQPLLLLLWKLRTADRGPVSDVTLTTGIWNSFHSHQSGLKPSRWQEIDPIVGLTVKFRRGLTFDTSTTAFYTPTNNYATSGNADFKLTYNDTFIPGLTLNPYVDYWVELNDKATVRFNPATSSRGSYVTLGATPTIKLGRSLTLDAATYANFVTADFYQRASGADGGSGLAIVSTAPRISMPLPFLGVTYGAWTGYLGVSYYHLSNEGLLDGNQLMGHGRDANLVKFRGGVTIFF